MSDAPMTSAGANPFSARTVLGLVLFGAVAFVALLWMIGAGLASGSANDGGNHAEGRGLNGFAAFSRFLEDQGYRVRHSRSDDAFTRRGLLVLTPPHGADGDDISEIIARRRRNGPTLLILPKWQAMRIPASLGIEDAKDGWVLLGPARAPRWADDVGVLGSLDIWAGKSGPKAARWKGFAISGQLPDPDGVQTISSGRIVSLVQDGAGQTLAGYLDDGSGHEALAAAASEPPNQIRGSDLHPVVIVAEPDLLDNYGFARQESAQLARALIAATTGGKPIPVTFDLTLNGLARNANLLTLAFKPPFLAATLCLLLAAIAVGWRAFLRFGPATRPERAIAFGKAALVANTAGFMRRTRRLHLVTGPYAERARERIAKALALQWFGDAESTDKAIDRALAVRVPDLPPFSQAASRLARAHSRHEAVRAARDIHAIERTLTT